MTSSWPTFRQLIVAMVAIDVAIAILDWAIYVTQV